MEGTVLGEEIERPAKETQCHKHPLIGEVRYLVTVGIEQPKHPIRQQKTVEHDFGRGQSVLQQNFGRDKGGSPNHCHCHRQQVITGRPAGWALRKEGTHISIR